MEAPSSDDARLAMPRWLLVCRLPIAAAALVLTFLSASTAPAQQPADASGDARPFQLRGFARVEGEYTDNFALTEKNKRDEFREILTPGLSLRFSTGRNHVEFTYAPSLIHSSLNDQDVQVFHLFDGNGGLALTERLDLKVTDHLLRSDQPALADPRGTQRNRPILLQNVLSSDLTYKQDIWSLVPHYAITYNQTEGGTQPAGTTGTAGADGSGERSVIQALGGDGTLNIFERNTLGGGYELTLADFKTGNDFVGNLGRASFSRQLNPLTSASLTGSAAHRNVQGGSDYNIFRGDVGLRREVSPLYTVEGRLGYGLFDVIGGSSRGEVEYSLKGTYTGKVIQLIGTSGQSFQETFLERQNIGVTRTTESNMEIRYEASEWVMLTLRGRVAQNQFLQSVGTTASGDQKGRKDLLFDGGLEVAFKLTRLLSLTLGYTYTRDDSNLSGFSYQNNRVRLGLTATYE